MIYINDLPEHRGDSVECDLFANDETCERDSRCWNARQNVVSDAIQIYTETNADSLNC